MKINQTEKVKKSYKKKPIDAIQWTGDNFKHIETWIRKSSSIKITTTIEAYIDETIILGDGMKANIGDMIIKGVNGEFYTTRKQY